MITMFIFVFASYNLHLIRDCPAWHFYFDEYVPFSSMVFWLYTITNLYFFGFPSLPCVILVKKNPMESH